MAQHRVHGAALDLVVSGADVPLVVVGRFVGIVGEGVALGTQLVDGGPELGEGGTDVGQLDDVGLGVVHQFAELGEGVGHPLVSGEVVGERCEDAGRERDVAGFHRDTCLGRERLDDRQERIRRQGGRLVGEGVEDGRSASHMVRNLVVTPARRTGGLAALG